MFSNKALKAMIIPLFIEQLLIMSVGVVDTFIIGSCGEASVSGVSLVNQFNTIFTMLFTALATGGAVVVSQYLGSEDDLNTSKSASQILMFSTLFSIVLSLFVYIFHKQLLCFLFGTIEQAVMDASVIYLKISIYSFIPLAIYNAGAAVYRSMGKNKTIMYISFISNIINVIGNIIGVYLLKLGVAGVAWPTFLARLYMAISMTYCCFKKSNIVHYQLRYILMWDKDLLHTILRIAIPNSLENAVFQGVKVALSSIVALFGTYQIAANGVAQSIWSLAALLSTAIAPVFVSVLGQCMGANDLKQAKYYFNKLLRWTMVLSILWNILILVMTPLLLKIYHFDGETEKLIFELVFIHNIVNGIALPLFSPLGSGLRAAGDVKFTMIISIISTVGVRLLFSYILALKLQLGVIGIALAMCMDWLFKGGIQYLRMKSGKWARFKVI